MEDWEGWQDRQKWVDLYEGNGCGRGKVKGE